VHDHKTGNICDDPLCKGELIDTIINFNENLQEKDLDLGFGHSSVADLCLCMGSSLRVTPAASMPEMVFQKGGKVVIVNL
jgi:NAD-dependent SIR2 family protein deacetylase